MTPAEAAALLTVAAAFDNRKPDEDQARAWALLLEDMRFEDCRDAIVAHYREHRDWLMPAEVVFGARKIRAARLADFGPILPPAHLSDDPAAELDWLRDTKRQIADGTITDPAQLDDRGALKPRDVAALGQLGRPVPRA